MKKYIYLFLLLFVSAYINAQTEVNSWTLNAGQYASYWENTNGSPTSPSFVFNTTTTLADVTKVCYDATYVYVEAEGMTENMGQFLNPGAPSAQGYTYIFPRTPTVPTTKTISPKEGSIGLLKNGVPIYGLGDSTYWNGSGNNGRGTGTWNVEVYKSEGFVLDATFGAHPQQDGAYHSHAKPYSLYSSTGTTAHSPIVGYAFDGFPVYGPYGYSTALDATSAITRMKSGYSLRNITQRHTLPYNVALTVANYGPNVNTTYPIGTYCEDYEWLATNGGHLDKYNGRFCVTPEYPLGTYAYFATIDATLTPQFPYYVGIEYYGAPYTPDITTGAVRTTPTTGVTCNLPTLEAEKFALNSKLSAFPNPSDGNFTISLPDLFGQSVIEIYTLEGQLLYTKTAIENIIGVNLPPINDAILVLKVTNNGKEYVTKMAMK
jgi:YHYH protein